MSDIFDHEGDAYDDLIWGRTADEGGHRRSPPQCRYCGAKYLSWSKASGTWRLYGLRGIHECRQYANRTIHIAKEKK